MIWTLGLTGGIGSGKTAATDEFARLGITVVDADLASRAIVTPGRPALQLIAERFGSGILLADGQLDRRALREIVFADPDQRRWLEALTHPLIAIEIREQLAAATSAYAILSSPLLFESQQSRMTHRTLVIDCPEELQLARAMRRDGATETGIQAIMAAQLSRQARLERADDVIVNDQGLDFLQQQIGNLHQGYSRLAREHRQAPLHNTPNLPASNKPGDEASK
jgi:dephospho-CoA kinase